MTHDKNSDGITPLRIGEWLKNDEKAPYRIPMYQRRYAWGPTEVEQLLHDLLNCPQDRPYYIGSLVVFKEKAEKTGVVSYEVIDGQQRLTTLLLIAAYFKLEGASANLLQFENRPKSQATLQTLFDDKPIAESDKAESAPALSGNFDVIKRFFEQGDGKDRSKGFADFLREKVVIMRIEVPPHTDVAHYFEIMNNRGEQLEMHEIVKARLLSALQGDDKARACLNQVWNACANMNQYVHFGFAQEVRQALFGKGYDNFPPAKEDELIRILGDRGNDAKNNSENRLSLKDIIGASEADKMPNDAPPEADKPDRFQSIVSFPNFLLLALAIDANQEKNGGQSNADDQAGALDDKKLLDRFNRLILAEIDESAKACRVKKFTLTLLRCRFLLDQFVIKRALDDEDALTLKRISRDSDKATPTASFSGPDEINHQIQMLQAAFHVSHPRQAFKYWLLGTLHWLNHQSATGNTVQGDDFLNHLESLAAAFMRDRYLAAEPTNYLDIIFSHDGKARKVLNQGISSRLAYPNIDNIFVFNYLDYLLWQKNREGKLFPDRKDKTTDKFIFKSGRGAIEHYFPQKRTDEWGYTPEGERKIDAFGNLSLISHAKNSRLSDHSPSEKNRLSGHPDKVPDSIKQHLMMNELKNNNEADWNPTSMMDHQDKMIELLHTKLSAQTTSPPQTQEKN